MLHRIGIVGPESSGKTTIARALAAWYSCFWVTEYAREYLEKLSRREEAHDLVPIAQGQLQREETAALSARNYGKRLLICDTTQLVMRVWALYQYERCPVWITSAWKAENYSLQLLCAPNIPWEEDPLRGLPNLGAREQVFRMYEEGLKQQGARYVLLEGHHLRRLHQATTAIQNNI